MVDLTQDLLCSTCKRAPRPKKAGLGSNSGARPQEPARSQPICRVVRAQGGIAVNEVPEVADPAVDGGDAGLATAPTVMPRAPVDEADGVPDL